MMAELSKSMESRTRVIALLPYCRVGVKESCQLCKSPKYYGDHGILPDPPKDFTPYLRPVRSCEVTFSGLARDSGVPFVAAIIPGSGVQVEMQFHPALTTKRGDRPSPLQAITGYPTYLTFLVMLKS